MKFSELNKPKTYFIAGLISFLLGSYLFIKAFSYSWALSAPNDFSPETIASFETLSKVFGFSSLGLIFSALIAFAVGIYRAKKK